jgi:hypothetical protein
VQRDARAGLSGLAVVWMAWGLGACGGSSAAPTPPSTPPTTTAPAPAPTPTPNPFAVACGTPLPALGDVYSMGIKVQLEPTLNRKVLNASPQIRNVDYCTAAGIPNTSTCSTRREDNPQRVPCDHYVAGVSATGRPGPDWYQDVGGRLLACGGVGGVPEEAPDCRLKPENQYLLDVSAAGQYVACSGGGVSPRVCSGCLIEEPFRVIHRNPAGLCLAS